MIQLIKEPVVFSQGVLVIPHLGITLRSLMGCAIANHAHTPKKKYPVHYRGVQIAEISLGKDFQ